MSEFRWARRGHDPVRAVARRARSRSRPIFRPRRGWRRPATAVAFAMAFLAVGMSLVVTVSDLVDTPGAGHGPDPATHIEPPTVGAGSHPTHPSEAAP